MHGKKISINKYNEWIDVNKLIQPSKNIKIWTDTSYIPYLMPFQTHIYLQVEPNAVSLSRDFLLKNWRRFTYIITYDDILLRQISNGLKYIFGTSWIPKHYYDNIDVSLKKFKISSLVGRKALAPGHTVRHQLYDRQKEFAHFPLTVYISTHGKQLPDIWNNVLLPNGDKINLFKEFQFSIVIENVSENTWFTEKLVDCLITKTIPIYWGCPSISEYFDTTGWIIFTNINDLKQKLELLDESYYSKYTDVINKNYETAKLYTDFHENVNRAIRTIPNW